MKCANCKSEYYDGQITCKVCGINFEEFDKRLIHKKGFCNCGQILYKGWKYCPNCKIAIQTDLNNFSEEIYIEKMRKKITNRYILSVVISSLLSPFFPPLYYYSMYLLIRGKIDNPENKSIQRFFRFYIVFIIIEFIFLCFLTFVFLKHCPSHCEFPV